MKKLLVCAILLIVILGAGVDFIYHRLPSMVSEHLTEKAEVPVHLKRVRVSPGAIYIHDFSVNNPKTDIFKHALTVKTMTLQTPYINYLFKDPIIIDHLSLQDVYVSLEISKDNTMACNWSIITKNMNNNSAHWYSNERKAFIKKLSFCNVTVAIKLYGKTPQVLSPIDRIEFANVDVENGIPTKEISKIIVNKMLNSLFSLEAIKGLFNFPLAPFKLFSKPFNKKGDPCEDYNNSIQSK